MTSRVPFIFLMIPFREDDGYYELLSPENQFFVEPSQNHKFEIYRVDKGVSTPYNEMEFFVYNFNDSQGRSGKRTVQEIVKK